MFKKSTKTAQFNLFTSQGNLLSGKSHSNRFSQKNPSMFMPTGLIIVLKIKHFVKNTISTRSCMPYSGKGLVSVHSDGKYWDSLDLSIANHGSVSFPDADNANPFCCSNKGRSGHQY